MMAGDDLDCLCFFARILLLRLDLGLGRVLALAPLALDELLDDLAAEGSDGNGLGAKENETLMRRNVNMTNGNDK
jgi:hypothetical protein